MEIKIDCAHTEVVNIDTLQKHPDNPNAHPEEQIKRLAKLIKYQGFRHPIIVSENSGFIVAGHGRLEAARLLGMKEVPVDYQAFETPEAEYSFLVSDNAVSLWAELDMAAIQLKTLDCGPDFDTDWLGIKDFFLPNVTGTKSLENTSGELDPNKFDNFQHQCPKCGFEWNIKIKNKNTGFTQKLTKPHEVMKTQTASGRHIHFNSDFFLSDMEVILGQTFPNDYNFMDIDPNYVCGMSVPPYMMNRISHQIYEQLLK